MDATTIQRIPIFKNLDIDVIEELLRESSNRISYYNEKEFIALQGDTCKSIYILCKGKVSAQMESIEGKLLTIETLNAPEILAPAFVYASENKFPVNIVAEEKSEILIINKEYFLGFMNKNPSVMKSFIQDISDRSLFLSKKVNEFALQNLRSRIIGYIEKYGPIKNQQAVSLRLGVARPSLSKVIMSLIDDGILEKSNNQIIIK